MKIKAVLSVITVIILSGCTGYGQVTKEQFEGSVDFVNCKLVEYSIWRSPNPEVKRADFQNACNCDDKPTYPKIKESIPPSIQATRDLAEEIESIKSKESYSEWNTTQTMDFLSKDSFPNYPKLDEFIRGKYAAQKNGEFRDYRNDIKAKLAVQLNSPPPLPSVSPSVSTNPTKPPDKDTSEDSYWLLKLFFGFIILFFILITVLYWWREIRHYAKSLFRKIKKKPSRISPDPTEDVAKEETDSNSLNSPVSQAIHFLKSENLKRESKIESVSSRLVEAVKRIDDFEGKNTVLKNQIEELKAELSNIKLSSSFSKEDGQRNFGNERVSQENSREKRQPETRQPKKTLYLPTPNPDGSFDESHALPNFKEGASIFRLTQHHDGTWKFELADIKAGIWYRDKNIDPVCEALNMHEEGMTMITTVEPGTAQYNNGVWKLVTKAKIRYEH